MKKSLVTTLCVIFLIVIVLAGSFFIGSDEKKDDSLWSNATYTENKEFGKGEKSFSVKVIAEESEVTFTIHTDKETVGEALLEHKLIEGEKGPYGLYVKYVNGIKADYDTDKVYWSFTKNSRTLETGVDMTGIENGAMYELTYTK